MPENCPAGEPLKDRSEGFLARVSHPQQESGRASIEVWCKADFYWLTGLSFLVALIYAELWLPGLVLIKRDAFQFFLPLKQYIYERLSHGELPQWFPYEGMGRPFLSIPVTGVFHPFTALYWLFSVQDAYRVSTLLSCILGATGTYALGRTYGISPAGAALSSIGFSCSGYVMSLTENLVYLYSVCALPVLLVTLQKSLVSHSVVWLGYAAIVWASIFLNGDVQNGYYAGFIGLLWVGVCSGTRLMTNLSRFMVVVGLAFLLASIQLAPAWSTFSQSTRLGGAVFQLETTHWSTHPLRLLNLVFTPVGEEADGDLISAALFGNNGITRGPGGYWAESLYLGLPLVSLALLGAVRCYHLRFFALLAVVTLLLGTGRHGGLYAALTHVVPFWSAFRYPEKFMGIASLAIAILAGGGLDIIKGKQTSPYPWFGMALVCLLLGGIISACGPTSDIVKWSRMPEAAATRMMTAWSGAALYSATVTLGVGLLIQWMRGKTQRQALALVAIVVLICGDLIRGNLTVVYTASTQSWNMATGLAEAIRTDAGGETLGQSRIFGIKDGTAQLSNRILQSTSLRERGSIFRRQGLYLEHNASVGIESLQNYLPSESSVAQQIGRKANLRVLARYNVAYLIGSPVHFSHPQFNGLKIATIPDYDLTLVRNPSPASPRVYLSKHPQMVASFTQELSFLEQEDFLSGEADVVETSLSVLPDSTTDGHVSLLEYHPEQVRLAIDTPHDAVLVLADAFELGWTARIEGGAALPVLRANGLLRAVVVPAGQARVVFSYETPFLRMGMLLSFFGAIVTVVLLWIGLRREQPVSSSQQSTVSY